MVEKVDSLSLNEVRRAAVNAQGLAVCSESAPEVSDTIDSLGCVQIDSMWAPRRAHELALLVRGVTITDVDSLMLPRDQTLTFESGDTRTPSWGWNSGPSLSGVAGAFVREGGAAPK
ncbi:hypothetical protein [Lysinibacter sp. HNR]|uniref:hypothetical protein n=1 Tax=Lysinibacter sp. HNR TaxID=3031408 RepID=UPI002435AF14|nr:hypothetical protein [Lysinibacter sp. HNR]WGD36537.1 hypothetical protein FrondiHNR_08630 [Lysinibacter sp. HNR]